MTKAPSKKTLAVVIGTALGAASLFVMVPAEESGREVRAEVVGTELKVTHVSGPEYLKAYADIVGVWTICDGDTKGVKKGMVETREGCLRRLEDQLIAHAEQVIKCVPGLYGQHHLAPAAVSLAYNIGWPSFCRSTAARRFNAGDWSGGCDAFLMWNKAKGKVMRGLVSRRQRERALCLQGVTA